MESIQMYTYEVSNPITGINQSAANFAEAQALSLAIKQQYITQFVDPLFVISVLQHNEDGSVTQSASDDSGYPLIT